MKSRLSLIFVALVVLLGAMVWVVQDRKTVTAVAAAPVAAPVQEIAAAPAIAVAPAPVPAPALASVPAAIVVVAPVAPIEVKSPAPPAAVPPAVRMNPSGDATYVARSGDTVSELAVALRGKDSKENRDAVIAANPSLRSNPDLVLAGQTYSAALDESKAVKASAAQRPDATPTAPIAPTHTEVQKAEPAPASPELTYAAQVGDTVRALAADLLGGDTKANRDAIVAENPSLQANPDHLVAGQSYTIPAPNGLAANPDAPAVKAPTTRPDSDDILRASAGRSLRYTARPGDTVSKLAVELIGSDSPANRELIIKNNPSLVADSDKVIAGTIYWIAAPTADVKH